MKKGFLLALITAWSFIAMAQDGEYLPKPGVHASYMGSLIYPGFKIGVEKPFKVTTVEKLKNNGSKRIYIEQYWGASFSMYHQPYFHTNYMLQGNWIHSIQKTSGFYFETNIGLGLSRTFLSNATYKVDDGGNVSKVSMAGNFYGLLNLGRSVGYNFNIRRHKPLKVFAGFEGMVLFPYQKFVYIRPAVELGMVYHLSGWNSNPKQYFKTKKRKGLFYKTISEQK